MAVMLWSFLGLGSPNEGCEGTHNSLNWYSLLSSWNNQLDTGSGLAVIQTFALRSSSCLLQAAWLVGRLSPADPVTAGVAPFQHPQGRPFGNCTPLVTAVFTWQT
jgi:hypothetical protein